MTLGLRYYDIEVDLEGSANSSFSTGFIPAGADHNDRQRYGTNLSNKYNGPGGNSGNPALDAMDHPDKAETDGTIGKVTYSWNPSEDLMYYVTMSEGFRPGLLNRPGGDSTGDGSYTVPFITESDEVTNYEFGMKSISSDGQLRFNGSVFMVDIEGLQTSILDPSITNLFFSDNAADAEITGVEGDFVYYPNLDGWMISGAFSLLDTEITKTLTSSGDVVAGKNAYATCAACHGADGKGNKALNSPKIAGLQDWYIARQLNHFKIGARGRLKKDIIGQQMRPMAMALDEDAINNLAVYIASLEGAPAMSSAIAVASSESQPSMSDMMAAAKPASLNTSEPLYATCTACHGENGEGKQWLGAPKISGQHDWYLKRQLKNWQDGIRGTHPKDVYGIQMRSMSMVMACLLYTSDAADE